MEILVPDLGEFADVEVIDVLVSEGNEVEVDQGLVTLETDKATMDVPAPQAGRVLSLLIHVGDRVSSGDAVLTLSLRADATVESGATLTTGAVAPGAADKSVEPVQREAPRRTPVAASAPLPGVDEPGFAKVHAGPSVRKLARELGVDLAKVTATGRKGRVTAEDLKAFVKQVLQAGAGPALPMVPAVDYEAFGPVEVERLTRIQKIAGPRLHASWVNVPHVTQHDEADITALEETRQSLKAEAARQGLRLTPLAFIIRACVLTLAEFPRFASSLSRDGESLVLKHYRHIGFAADTPNGLVVPVIRDAERMNVYELASALAELSEQARAGELGSDELQGGVFTISSLGGIGGTSFTPIINAPEVAILGVSRSQQRPIYHDGALLPRLMLPLSLSYDHRVIDGAAAARFTTFLSALLGQAERLVEGIS